MKKLIYTLIVLLSFIGIVNASTTTYDRESKENLGVTKFKLDTENKKAHARKTPLVDASEKIYDFADILTDKEEKDLYKLIENFIDKYHTDLVIVTIDMSYFSDNENENYAADFYDYNDFGIDYKNYDGILLLRNAYANDPYYDMYTFGDAQRYFDQSRYDDILDGIYPQISSKNYYVGFSNFIGYLERYYKKGVAPTYRNYYVDENGFLRKGYSAPIVPAFIISGIVTAIAMGIMINKNKMVKKAYEAGEYIDKDSITYRQKTDTFVTSNVTRTYSPRSSGGGGSGGGGSHGGSSGGGHSSGGGRHG